MNLVLRCSKLYRRDSQGILPSTIMLFDLLSFFLEALKIFFLMTGNVSFSFSVNILKPGEFQKHILKKPV